MDFFARRWVDADLGFSLSTQIPFKKTQGKEKKRKKQYHYSSQKDKKENQSLYLSFGEILAAAASAPNAILYSLVSNISTCNTLSDFDCKLNYVIVVQEGRKSRGKIFSKNTLLTLIGDVFPSSELGPTFECRWFGCKNM